MTDYRIEEIDTDILADKLRQAMKPITPEEIDATIKRIHEGIEKLYAEPTADNDERRANG